MDKTEARNYILAHDEQVRALNRKPKHELAAIWQSYLLGGNAGQYSKDELIGCIIDAEYPRAAEARRVYYAAVAS